MPQHCDAAVSTISAPPRRFSPCGVFGGSKPESKPQAPLVRRCLAPALLSAAGLAARRMRLRRTDIGSMASCRELPVSAAELSFFRHIEVSHQHLRCLSPVPGNFGGSSNHTYGLRIWYSAPWASMWARSAEAAVV